MYYRNVIISLPVTFSEYLRVQNLSKSKYSYCVPGWMTDNGTVNGDKLCGSVVKNDSCGMLGTTDSWMTVLAGGEDDTIICCGTTHGAWPNTIPCLPPGRFTSWPVKLPKLQRGLPEISCTLLTLIHSLILLLLYNKIILDFKIKLVYVPFFMFNEKSYNILCDNVEFYMSKNHHTIYILYVIHTALFPTCRWYLTKTVNPSSNPMDRRN